MHETRSLLRRAAWRLALTEFCRSLIVAIAGGLAALIALRLVQQLWPIQQALPWTLIGIWTGVAAVVVALGWTIVTRAKPKAVARRVDEVAQLKESISTALCVLGSQE